MTLYFDTKIEFLDSDAVSTISSWHPSEPLFAVASFSPERGGSVTIFADTGEPQRDVTYPVHATSQATALCWHPEKALLASGWEHGDIHVWFAGHREFASVNAPHKAAIVLLQFSEQGGRMVTADAMGLVTGWRCDGQYQFLTMFSHDLREVLLLICFRLTVESEVREEMANLAKAAVAGDENALDTLTNWRPRTAARSMTHSGVRDNHCFYACTQGGVVYYINQGGACVEVMKCGSLPPIVQMLWHPRKDAVICLMEDLTVTLFLVESTGILTELDRVKMSGRGGGRQGGIAWSGNSLAIITGDFFVRIWDIERSDNYLLKMDLPSGNQPGSSMTTLSNGTMSSSNQFFSHDSSESSGVLRKTPKYGQLNGEMFTCLAYSSTGQTLCAGTSQGNVYTWKRSGSRLVGAPEDAWQLTNISSVRGAIRSCEWGYNELAKPCMLVNCLSNVFMLKEQPLLAVHTRELWAVQRSAKSVQLTHCSGREAIVQSEFAVTAMALSELSLVMSNGRSISSYSLQKVEKSLDEFEEILQTVEGTTPTTESTTTPLSLKLLQTFAAECLALNLCNQNIFCLGSSDVFVYSVGGVVLHRIQASDIEGKIIGMDLSGCYLSVFTMNGYVKAYDVSRHDPKLLFPSKSGHDIFDDFGEFILVKCNSSGSHLAMVIASSNFTPISTLFCWDFERSNLLEYGLLEPETNAKKESSTSLPVRIFWDAEEPRLLATEVKSMIQKTLPQKNSLQPSHFVQSKVVLLFYSEKGCLNVLETQSMSPGCQLLNLCVPNVIRLKINTMEEQPLQDFVDLQQCNPVTRKQVLNFSLYVAEGNMDMAYRSIRSIQSKVIWTNLAKMCVHTNRLDVAKVCMGHLEQARSVRALRQAIEDDDLETEAKVAVLAIELGMIEEAKDLYRRCKRFDLLNKLLQSIGHLDEAVELAEAEDRIHLKHTYYQKAQELRERGDIKGALEYFEKTQNPAQNITQLLLENPGAMKRYIQTTSDPKLLKWWGQYIESSGDMDAALAVYHKAEDWFSQVKILCYLGKISKADAIARQSGDRAACYHLARHYENVGKFQEAIMFFTRAQTFSNAIRICKENDFQEELWTVASSSRQRDKAIAAAYFEECGNFKHAVELYHRAGMLHKALEMAFESQQPEILEIIASDLAPDSDAELINRCADFFCSIEQFQKAVHLLAKTRHLERALGICSEKGVPVTEELSEMLTPEKGEFEEATRVHILVQLGEFLQQQGDYHSATKKFTQAGDKIRAMKSLLKSGNTDKIIFFANMSRQREVYIMAANYLQALDWQSDPQVLKHIVTFYTKGQAFDSLANFYAICAQIEIEEFQDYGKALTAMQEASKCLEKLSHAQHVYNNLQRTVADVKAILEIQQALREGDHQLVIGSCRSMLIKPELPPIRHAHILAMLIRALVYVKDYSEAGRALKELTVKDSTWSASGLLDRSIVHKIAQECHLEFDLIWNAGRQVTASTSGTAATGMSSTSGMTTTDDDDADDEEITEELH
uniref:Reduced mechanoreceptor potential A, isoform B n=1 Tax=Drosophila melanogaster TaxID=7227 RepID=Q7KTZ4_DROME|nr:reduced mechanoreceptor potential A, isoform B [Drosophila melanogaster]AAS64635.1 reduced mechanoreceptor potential A, isoform B [Drosophila melanogaster]|eukprot:NP_995608.1 reduced mechanoreceptor potential A, isoform B [Drosophila melanogaster]